jgi:hypothetical protein
MIASVLLLVAWTLVMWLVMYLRRIPAMQKAGIDPQSAALKGSLDALPPAARQAADNYNHLHEQPTIFYALALAIQIAGIADPVFVGLAYAYVASRVVHSLVQVTVNRVMVRFALFSVGSILLMVMVARALVAVL